MRKNQTLFTMALLVLLGSMGAAQAQGFAEVKLFTTPMEYAREGGKNEAAGSILLNVSDDAGDPLRMKALRVRWGNDNAAFLRSPCGKHRHHNPRQRVSC